MTTWEDRQRDEEWERKATAGIVDRDDLDTPSGGWCIHSRGNKWTAKHKTRKQHHPALGVGDSAWEEPYTICALSEQQLMEQVVDFEKEWKERQCTSPS